MIFSGEQAVSKMTLLPEELFYCNRGMNKLGKQRCFQDDLAAERAIILRPRDD
jgi:hypothetical protein